MGQPITGQGVGEPTSGLTVPVKADPDDTNQIEIDWQQFLDRGGSEQIKENRGT